MNRLSRDEICHAALDLADLPQLDQHDRPGGAILRGAHTVGWLQRGLDYFYNHWPWAANVKTLTWTLTVGLQEYNVNASPINPDQDFVLDVKDGLLITPGSTGNRSVRALGRGIQDLIDWRAGQIRESVDQQIPVRYALTPPTLHLWPAPDRAYTAILYYYSMPIVLANGTVIPTFPDDDVLTDYVHLKCLEWARVTQPGTAKEFAKTFIGRMQSTRLGRESELNNIPLGRESFRSMRSVPTTDADWMGETTV